MDNQRHRIILNELDKKGNVTVASLVELTGASESSIRRDLVELDHQGFLKRVHGGATLIPKVTQTIEDPLGKRQLLNADEKKKIAKYAAGMIEANDVVYLDAGSSTLELIEYLDQKEAHYITNGLMQAQQLTLKGFHVVCLGGEVRNITGACVGANTMKSLSRYHFSKGFFGTNGIDLMNGFTAARNGSLPAPIPFKELKLLCPPPGKSCLYCVLHNLISFFSCIFSFFFFD